MTSDKIVGGEPTPSPIPWQVSIRTCSSGTCHLCGGTILDSKTILSAGHCFKSFRSSNIKDYSVLAGAVSRFDTSSGQVAQLEGVIWNTEQLYDDASTNNDFIILKLASSLTFNDKVKPACLPEPNYAPEFSGMTCFVSGWGSLEQGDYNSPTKLQWVGVPLITNSQCSSQYPESWITSSMICAGFPEGGKDSCQGDSGGPLVCSKNGKAVITGVVSFGNGCALPNYAGVYARVTKVLTWIKNNMVTFLIKSMMLKFLELCFD